MSRGGCGGTSIAHASKVSLMWRMIGWVTWLLDVSSFEFWLLGVSKPEKVVESPYSVRKVVSAIMRWTILLPSLVLSLSTWRARLGTCRLHWENNWSCRISLVAHWYSSWVCTLLQHRAVGSSSLWLLWGEPSCCLRWYYRCPPEELVWVHVECIGKTIDLVGSP